MSAIDPEEIKYLHKDLSMSSQNDNMIDIDSDKFLESSSNLDILNRKRKIESTSGYITPESSTKQIKPTFESYISSGEADSENDIPDNVKSKIIFSGFFTILKRVIKKCSMLWNKASRPKTSEIIFTHLKVNLSYPVVTRWNSLFDALKKILRVKEKINILCEELLLPTFTHNDFNYLEEYCSVMKPLAETLDFLQGEKSMLFGYLIPSLVTLQTKLRKIYSSDKIQLLKPIAIELEKRLIQRFQPYFSLSPDVNDAIVASVLCPDIKLKCFPALKSTAIDCSAGYINKIVIEYANAMKDSNLVERPLLNKRNSVLFLDFGEEELTSPSVTYSNENVVEAEYHLYLADRSMDISMLNKYPILKNLSLRINTTLTSSAPVERLFSFATIINSPRRHALSDANFEKLILLKANKF